MSGPGKNGMTWAEVVYFSWRDLGILLARTRGDTLRQIGKFYGLSHETIRFRLIVAKRRFNKHQRGKSHAD